MNILILEDSTERIKRFRAAMPNATVVMTARECIQQLTKQDCDALFLDHDLGNCVYVDTAVENTGSGVVRWMLENTPNCARVFVHTLNDYAGDSMEIALSKSGYYTIRCPFGSHKMDYILETVTTWTSQLERKES